MVCRLLATDVSQQFWTRMDEFRPKNWPRALWPSLAVWPTPRLSGQLGRRSHTNAGSLGRASQRRASTRPSAGAEATGREKGAAPAKKMDGLDGGPRRCGNGPF